MVIFWWGNYNVSLTSRYHGNKLKKFGYEDLSSLSSFNKGPQGEEDESISNSVDLQITEEVRDKDGMDVPVTGRKIDITGGL